jgi:hypothetical protein
VDEPQPDVGLASSLDAIVEDFCTRLLDWAPYPYLVRDALEVSCREGGRTVASVMHAILLDRDGYRGTGMETTPARRTGARAVGENQRAHVAHGQVSETAAGGAATQSRAQGRGLWRWGGGRRQRAAELHQ